MKMTTTLLKDFKLLHLSCTAIRALNAIKALICLMTLVCAVCRVITVCCRVKKFHS